jgi:hypothetical protein
MRKLLLASVATLGAVGVMGSAFAQTTTVVTTAPAAPGPVPTQGQSAWTPAASPPAGANNNNNYQAPMLPGPVANPTPGTMVVHFNGKVEVDAWGLWSSVDKRVAAAPAGTPGGAIIPPGGPAGGIVGVTPGATSGATSAAAILGNNGAGTVSVYPQGIASFARLYAGADGMATNGLRYGAAIEVRQNYTGEISGSGSSGSSGYSSLETLFVRRAFTYVAGDQWGIFRIGQADGLISIFDNGVTTFQFLATGNLNGGDLQDFPSNVSPPFVFMGQAGNEYDNAKAVYLSPQIAGFDFGLQYAPNSANGFGEGGNNTNGLGNSIISSGTGTGLGCTVANTGCPQLSSGPGAADGSRIMNQAAVGVRYQGTFGGVGILAYGVYEGSGHATYTGAASSTLAGVANLGNASVGGTAAKFTGNFNGLSIGSGGIAVTFAGFTVGGNVVGGRMNGQMGLQPVGGAPLTGFLLGAKYVAGPLTVGIVGEDYTNQGNVNLTGITQLRARAIDFGAQYTVAPGYNVYAEYLWQDQYQGARNFITGAIGTAAGSGANNEIKGQGFLIGNQVAF